MFYLISKDDLERLVKGKVKAEDLTIPEKEVLITWSGEDVKLLLEQENLTSVDLEEAVDIVKKIVGNCDCAVCVENAFNCVKEKAERWE